MSAGQLKAIFTFYRHFYVVPLLINILCCYLYFVDGLLFEVIMIKLVTDVGLRYFIVTLQSGKLFYYYNQHISKRMLWISYFLTDFVLLALSLCLINVLK